MAVDAASGQIVASELTGQDVYDTSQVQPLLDQIDGSIEQVSADGAYDGEPTYDAIAARNADIAVVIPTRDGAVPSAQFEREPTQRDTHQLLNRLAR